MSGKKSSRRPRRGRRSERNQRRARPANPKPLPKKKNESKEDYAKRLGWLD